MPSNKLDPIEHDEPSPSINWIVKASKLCNLRCRYCYEWNDLANPTRMSLDQWDKLLRSIRWYHERRVNEVGAPVRTVIIWHGGEPLLLPPDYITDVMRIQRRWLARELKEGTVRNTLQTNLYRVTDTHLDVLEHERIHIGISLDVFGGVRLDAAGNETETTVARNIERLQDRGIVFGGIAVLAAHTKDRLLRIYDFYEGLGVAFRVLPLFDAPLNVPEADFHLPYADMVSALRDLFRYWLTRRRPIPVYPLVTYLDTVLRRRLGRPCTQYDRAQNGEWAILVDTDGMAYQVPDAYDRTRAMGNLFEHSIREILRSPAYQDSLTRDQVVRRRVCGPCEYRGSCSTLPLFEARRENWKGERCAIAYDMHGMVEEELRARRMGARRAEAFWLRATGN
jgi:uncharacterized protein